MAGLIKCLAALCFVMFGVGVALGAGTAVVVDPEAIIKSGGQQRVLTQGSEVLIGDLIQTSSGGHVELAFDDGTKIVVGPGSALLIEDYLLRGDGSAGDFAVGALGGTFRFMSGNAAKERYRITTPTGTIGIRGTEFDLVSDRRDGARVLMYSGTTNLCSFSGACVTVGETCGLGEITRTGASSLGLTTTFTRDQRRELRSHFVYGNSQQVLSDDYRIPQTGKCLLSPMGLDQLFSSSDTQQSGAAPDDQPGQKPAAGDVPPPKPDPQPKPDPKADPQPPVDGGDCRGNSNHNPGNSQNCSK